MKKIWNRLRTSVIIASVVFTSPATMNFSYAGKGDIEKLLEEERDSAEQERERRYDDQNESPDELEQNEPPLIPRNREEENRKQAVKDQIQKDDETIDIEPESDMLFQLPISLLETYQSKVEIKITTKNISELPGIDSQQTTDITGEPKSLQDWYVYDKHGTDGGKPQLIIKQGKMMEEDYQTNVFYRFGKMVTNEIINKCEWITPSFVDAVMTMDEEAKSNLLPAAFKNDIEIKETSLKSNEAVTKEIFAKGFAYYYGGYRPFMEEHAKGLKQYFERLDWEKIKAIKQLDELPQVAFDTIKAAGGSIEFVDSIQEVTLTPDGKKIKDLSDSEATIPDYVTGELRVNVKKQVDYPAFVWKGTIYIQKTERNTERNKDYIYYEIGRELARVMSTTEEGFLSESFITYANKPGVVIPRDWSGLRVDRAFLESHPEGANYIFGRAFSSYYSLDGRVMTDPVKDYMNEWDQKELKTFFERNKEFLEKYGLVDNMSSVYVMSKEDGEKYFTLAKNTILTRIDAKILERLFQGGFKIEFDAYPINTAPGLDEGFKSFGKVDIPSAYSLSHNTLYLKLGTENTDRITFSVNNTVRAMWDVLYSKYGSAKFIELLKDKKVLFEREKFVNSDPIIQSKIQFSEIAPGKNYDITPDKKYVIHSASANEILFVNQHSDGTVKHAIKNSGAGLEVDRIEKNIYKDKYSDQLYRLTTTSTGTPNLEKVYPISKQNEITITENMVTTHRDIRTYRISDHVLIDTYVEKRIRQYYLQDGATAPHYLAEFFTRLMMAESSKDKEEMRRNYPETYKRLNDFLTSITAGIEPDSDKVKSLVNTRIMMKLPNTETDMMSWEKQGIIHLKRILSKVDKSILEKVALTHPHFIFISSVVYDHPLLRDDKDVGRNDDLNETIGVTLAAKKMMINRILPDYTPKDYFDTPAHELGHYIDFHLFHRRPSRRREFDTIFNEDKMKPAKERVFQNPHIYLDTGEYFAESFSDFCLYPELLKSKSNKLYQFMNDVKEEIIALKKS